MGFGFGGIGSFINILSGGGGEGSSASSAQAILNSIAQGAYGDAMGMAGNEGQFVLIAQIGEGGFQDATNGYYADNEDPAETLSAYTSHPEAIEEILGDIGSEIESEVDSVREMLQIVEHIES